MIEINLIPDIKQELIDAKRIRTYVISSAIIVGVVSIGIVVVLAVYLFGVQTLRDNLADSAIKDSNSKLQSVNDLSNTLTIQNQLTKLSAMHSEKNIDSRLFALLTAINPAAPNQVSISSVKLTAEDKAIVLEGQATNGYEAAESFKKTILGTTLAYNDKDDQPQTVKLTNDVTTSDMSYGEDATGKKVLRFTFSFNYDDAFFARSSDNAIIQRPDRKNVTDSYLRVPQSLFGERAANIEGDR